MAQFSIHLLALLSVATLFATPTFGAWPGNTLSEKIDLLITVYPKEKVQEMLNYCKTRLSDGEKEWKETDEFGKMDDMLDKLKNSAEKRHKGYQFKKKMEKLFVKKGQSHMIYKKYIGIFVNCVKDSHRLKSFWLSALLSLVMLERNGTKVTGTQKDDKIETKLERAKTDNKTGSKMDVKSSKTALEPTKMNLETHVDIGTKTDSDKTKLTDKEASANSNDTECHALSDKKALPEKEETENANSESPVKHPSQKRQKNKSSVERLMKSPSAKRDDGEESAPGPLPLLMRRHSGLLSRSNSGRSSRSNSVDYSSQGYTELRVAMEEQPKVEDEVGEQPKAPEGEEIGPETTVEKMPMLGHWEERKQTNDGPMDKAAEMDQKEAKKLERTLAFDKTAEPIEPESPAPKLEWSQPSTPRSIEANANEQEEDMALFSPLRAEEATALQLADTVLDDLSHKLYNHVEAFSTLYKENKAFSEVFALTELQKKNLKTLKNFNLQEAMAKQQMENSEKERGKKKKSCESAAKEGQKKTPNDSST